MSKVRDEVRDEAGSGQNMNKFIAYERRITVLWCAGKQFYE